MVQQTNNESTGNNTSTYNPQKTQGSSQKASPGEQQTSTVEMTDIAGEFEPKNIASSFSSTDGYIYLLVFMLLPLAIILSKIKISAK